MLCPRQQPGLGMEVGREREAKPGRCWWGTAATGALISISDKESAGKTNPMSGWLRLRRYLCCFLLWEGNCTLFHGLGRTEVIWMMGTCCFGPFHPDGLLKTFPAGSSRSCAGGNPRAGHPCSPPSLRNTALIPVLPTREGTETQNPISLKSCSGSCTASPSLSQSCGAAEINSALGFQWGLAARMALEVQHQPRE